ncbi:MAG TPA: VCBS repeat-containing protein, partial [Anaerolineae bacterium]|nr:VCBS repeat-containing protein [Anaerolineae bacterium]
LGDIAWGDYDNDGDLDILLTGANGSTKISRIYRNDDGAFTDIGAGLAGVRDGAVAWGDYDSDGDLDILLTGLDFFNAKISKLYRNDNGIFTEVSTSLIGVDLSSVAWGDYDNDGDLDILLSGQVNGSTRVLKVYRNDNGLFTDLALPISGIKEGMVSWGDYDNDGDLDILFAGTGPGGRTTRIYDNDGGLFTDINAGLPGIGFGFGGVAAWGDVDTDGDLDILIVGSSNNGSLTTIYRNNDCPVEVDITLTLTVVGTDLQLTWPDAGTNCVHNIYESTTPYTPPTVITYANQTSGLFLPRTGDVDNNYYFIVESTCDGNVIGTSQEAGEFDFAITN